MSDQALHVIEPIVTNDTFELGVHRMTVPGGWLYWLSPGGGAFVSNFVPYPEAADLASSAPASSVVAG